jgi:hypothetical protein
MIREYDCDVYDKHFNAYEKHTADCVHDIVSGNYKPEIQGIRKANTERYRLPKPGNVTVHESSMCIKNTFLNAVVHVRGKTYRRSTAIKADLPTGYELLFLEAPVNSLCENPSCTTQVQVSIHRYDNNKRANAPHGTLSQSSADQSLPEKTNLHKKILWFFIGTLYLLGFISVLVAFIPFKTGSHKPDSIRRNSRAN